jgi:hypothetical protein
MSFNARGHFCGVRLPMVLFAVFSNKKGVTVLYLAEKILFDG